MKIPTTLKHKPVMVAEDYGSISTAAPPTTPTPKASPLGLAQWNDRGKVDISAMVAVHRGEVVPPVGGAAPHRVLIWRFWTAGPSSISRRSAYRFPRADPEHIPGGPHRPAGGGTLRDLRRYAPPATISTRILSVPGCPGPGQRAAGEHIASAGPAPGELGSPG